MKTPYIVTGLSGLIGSKLANQYKDHFSFENIDLSTGIDITDKDAVSDAIAKSSAPGILHLAAFTDVTIAHEQYGDTEGLCYQINVIGTQNVAQAAKDSGKHVVYVSTDFVFDGKKDGPYTEEDVPDPIEWYGQTKFLGEQAITENLDNYTIIRLASPYTGHPVRPDFVALIIEGIRSGNLYPQFTDKYITPTYIEDLISIFAHAIKHQPQGVYHAVGSSWHTNYEAASMINETCKLGGTIKAGSLEAYLKTAKRPYQQSLKLSNAKLVKEFGIKPKTFQEGLNEIFSEPETK